MTLTRTRAGVSGDTVMADVRSRSLRRGRLDTHDWASEALLCISCREEVTGDRARIDVAGAHRHDFFNPQRIHYAVACFAPAHGCRAVGEQTDRFTWFAGYSWAIALCRRWYATQGAGGEEPPPEFKEYLDLAIGWAAETDEEKALQMARSANIMAYRKALWLGIGAGAQQFTFVRDTLVNMPLGHFQPDSWVAWKYLPEGWWLE